MPEAYTTGYWTPKEGHEDDFVAAWTEFARWGSEHSGAHVAYLTRIAGTPSNYVSLMAWDSMDEVHAWKRSPEFKQRMAVVQEHVAKFNPAELEVVAAAGTEAATG